MKCAVNGISTRRDNLGAKPGDKCKTLLPQRAKLMDSAQPTVVPGKTGGQPKVGINKEYSRPPTLMLEIKFEALINLNET